MKSFRFLSISLTIGMLLGCIPGSDNNNETLAKANDKNVKHEYCSVVDANAQLYGYLKASYLWYSDIPTDFSPEAHDSVHDALLSIRNSVDKDRFSFSLTKDEYDDYLASI